MGSIIHILLHFHTCIYMCPINKFSKLSKEQEHQFVQILSLQKITAYFNRLRNTNTQSDVLTSIFKCNHRVKFVYCIFYWLCNHATIQGPSKIIPLIKIALLCLIQQTRKTISNLFGIYKWSFSFPHK